MTVEVTSTAPINNNSKEYLIRFPPFPSIPSGAIIIPFNEYKESGIMIAPGGTGVDDDDNHGVGDNDSNKNENENGTEVDGYGIPTIVLASSHTTDWCKTNTKRQKYNQEGRMGGLKRRKKRKGGGGGAGSGPSVDDWEEYWEDREARYRINSSYDPLAEPFERFYQGAFDFKNGRPWPLAQKQRGPTYVWGEFCRFAGIPTGPENISNTTTTPKKEKAEGNNSDSDFDDDEEDDEAGVLHPSNLVAADVMLKAQAKAESFLKDPAYMLKVFLSSYARDRGIIWTKENLRGAPVLMQFFINYMINNNVLPKREENAIKHDSTKRVLEIALKELPLTAEIARSWPDDFSKACKETWGSRAEVYKFRGFTPEPDQDQAKEVPPPPPADEGWGNENGNGNGNGNGNRNEDGWGTTNGDGETGWGGGDNVDSGWSEGGGTGWEDVSGIEEINDDNETIPTEVNADEVVQATIEKVKAGLGLDSKTSTTGKDEASTWVYTPPNFFQVLGPTALPLTHTPGIVESSVRRIKAVHPVSTDPAKFPVTKDISPDAVEGALKKNFGVVVFEPWLNWNRGEEGEEHLSNPKILETSKGLVVPEYQNPIIAQAPPVTSTLPPFDPSKDDISVIVDPEHLKFFSVGMGTHCTWVQMARVEDFEQQPGKKKKKNAKMDRYWYIEESLLVVPSYYSTAP